MRTFGQSPGIPVAAILVAVLAAFLPGVLAASNNSSVPSQTYSAIEPNTLAGRNHLLESRVAEQLNALGFAGTSRILVLATGERVYLLGVTPDLGTKQRIAQVVGEVLGVRDVADYLLAGRMVEPTNDELLRRDVELALHLLATDSDAAAANIHVQTHNADVLLRGRVRGWDDVAKAIQAAFSAGAKYVVSDLTVANSGQSAADRYEGEPANRMEHHDGFLGYVAEPNYPPAHDDTFAAPGPDRRPGRFSPRWVQSAQDRQAQKRLASRLLVSIEGGEHIHVLVQDRQAFLFGRVASEAERRRAARLAMSVEGVEHVRNRLSVAPKGWRRRADPDIEDAVKTELYWNPFADAEQVDVSVDAGVVVLSGTVDSFGAAIAAIESAFDGGARSVRNQLRVSRQIAGGGMRNETHAAGGPRGFPETAAVSPTR